MNVDQKESSEAPHVRSAPPLTALNFRRAMILLSNLTALRPQLRTIDSLYTVHDLGRAIPLSRLCSQESLIPNNDVLNVRS